MELLSRILQIVLEAALPILSKRQIADVMQEHSQNGNLPER